MNYKLQTQMWIFQIINYATVLHTSIENHSQTPWPVNFLLLVDLIILYQQMQQDNDTWLTILTMVRIMEDGHCGPLLSKALTYPPNEYIERRQKKIILGFRKKKREKKKTC